MDLATQWWMTQVCSRLQNVFDDNIIYKVSCGVLEATNRAESSESWFCVFLPHSVFSEVMLVAWTFGSWTFGSWIFILLETGQCYKADFPPLPESWMLNIHQHTAGRDQAWRSNRSRLAPKTKLWCSLMYPRRVLGATNLWFLTLKVKLIVLPSLKTMEKIKWDKVMWNTSNKT